MINQKQNFDASTFDPNAGRLDAYNKRWSNYLSNLSNGLNKINVKKARGYFDQQFNKDWEAGALDRASAFAQKQTDNFLNKYRLEFNNMEINSRDLDVRDYELAGYNYNTLTGNWDAPQVTPLKPAPVSKPSNFWLTQALAVNPDFKSIEDVMAWQSANGLDADGKFGKKSKETWDKLKQSTPQPAQPSNQPPVGTVTTEHASYNFTDGLGRIPFGEQFGIFGKNSNTPKLPVQLPKVNSVQATTNRYLNNNTVQWKNGPIHNFVAKILGSFKKGGYFQQGGEMGDDYREFMSYLIDEAKAENINPEEIEAYISSLSPEVIKTKYEEFKAKKAGLLSARLGAQLLYLKKLKGMCPEGLTRMYFKMGGRVCSTCVEAQKGDKMKDPRKEWKKMKNNKKLDLASKDSIAANKFGDLDVLNSKPGKYKKGVWTPDRSKAPYKKK